MGGGGFGDPKKGVGGGGWGCVKTILIGDC